jgi:ribosomal protein L9
MDVILLQDVEKVGLRGEVVSVARGYARNFLLPRRLAEPATAGRVAEVRRLEAERARQEARSADQAREIAEVLGKTVLRFDVKSGPTDSLFGSATPTDIADEIWRARKVRVDRRKIDADPLKRIGRYSIPIELFADVQVEVKTIVVPEGGELPPEEELAALEAAEAEAERQRVEAADNLARMRDLEKQQVDATNAISRFATERAAIQKTAQSAKAEDERQYSDLLAERERIEKELKELARKEEEEERKRQERERKEREKKKNDDGGGNDNDDDGGGNDDGGGDDNGSGLSRPVNGYITSPYGMRFHPILHRWKLHDGTDFGAGCGTPIHAAASGKVIRRYYNGGYGNRIFVSHGRMNGKSVVTSYNHLSRYSARVGETVSRGEVIGYVGTTGYSTGCHLHFMVYVNGDTVNPMRWL